MEQSKFVLEIQSRECLWNPKVESYYDDVKKRLAWEEVATKLWRDFLNFSDDEKRDAVQELQRTWESLKYYHRIRNPSTSNDKRRSKPIIELLQFLDKVTEFEMEAKADQRVPQPVNQRVKIKHKNFLFYPKEEDLSFTIEAHSLDPNNMTNDSNINFLQCILPEMQSLNDRQRFEFKLGVMQLIKRLKQDEEVDATGAPKDPERIQKHANCEMIKSFECFSRSVSPLLLTINRCNGCSPTIYNAEIDVSPKTLDVMAQDHTYIRI